MIAFTPPRKLRSAMLFSVSCGAAGLLLYAMSSYIGHRFILLPIASAALVILGLWFLHRFALVSYRYEIRRGVLCVIRCLHRQQRTVYTLDLKTAFSVVSEQDHTNRPKERPRRVHNFVCTWPTEHAVRLYYRDAGVVCAVILEDNPAFFSSVRACFPQQMPDDNL